MDRREGMKEEKWGKRKGEEGWGKRIDHVVQSFQLCEDSVASGNSDCPNFTRRQFFDR
jgi:hypothetical protein